jgi:hypothetical protein
MDRQSHYTWTLTRDELHTIQDALRDDEKRLYKRAKSWADAGDSEMERLCEDLAHNRFDLLQQIARMLYRY